MLYDMRVHKGEWYGPYFLTDEDCYQLGPTVEIRKHNCDDLTENGTCGHVAEGLPAPY